MWNSIAEKTDASFEYNEESGGEVEEDEVMPEEGSKKRDKRRKHRDHGREKRRKSREDHHKVCIFSWLPRDMKVVQINID